MDLRRVAAKFEHTEFEGYDEDTQTWDTEALTGKVFPVDRFLSNFHRPTRRRMLGLAPGTVLPDSSTIKVPETGEIFMIGEVRQDARNGAAYDSVGILHRAETTCTVNRKAPAGPTDNPGHLVNSEIGHHYVDIELRALQEQEEAEEEFEGHYFIVLPPHADIEEWDQITISSDNYFIKSSYIDSGFKFARADKREDPRVDFTYHRREDTSAYNASTGVVTDGLVGYDVTGFSMREGILKTDFSLPKQADITIIVRQDHIGFAPVSEDEFTWKSVKYRVSRVELDFLQQQYKIHGTL
ncbi:MAG: hypothetical protein PVI43_00070 [Candidatus Bathyarchaeota archaeon]|jgi:hypothetical protein